jgi:hypothetical protein
MESMLLTGTDHIDAERAFARAARGRRVQAALRRLRGRSGGRGNLEVFDEHRLARGARPERGVREIPLDAIGGTLEPSRAKQFDRQFRPAGIARTRWQRLWVAEQRGTPLPPISVIRVGNQYVLRDGHHRVSVAKARGAETIDASVDAVAA